MKHLKKFNESVDPKSFKNDNEDIKYFFTDYTDENPDALTITDALIYEGRVIDNTTYMKDTSKYRRCKVIKLIVGKSDGIETKNEGHCFTSFDILKNAVADIERFYALSGEEINYTINTDYDELEITFVTLGDLIKADETNAEKIDGYLQRVKEWVRKRGHKKQTIGGNWLDMRFIKKGAPSMGYDYYVSTKLIKVADGILNLDNATDDSDIELITIRNEAWEDGLKFAISGGDNQVVLKLVKR